jgi:hypothetical protein
MIVTFGNRERFPSDARRAAICAIVIGIVISPLMDCDGGSSAGTPPPPPPPGPTVTATSATDPTLGAPFDAVASSSGDVFVSVTADGTPGSATGVQVFQLVGGGLASSCVEALPAPLLGPDTTFADLGFFPGESDIAGGIGYAGAIFYSVAGLLGCNAPDFVVGQASSATNDAGTLAVAVTRDGNFAFMANEYGVAPGAVTSGNIGVVQIVRDGGGNFTTATALLGQISTGGNAIAGMTLSPDGTRLYVTSEVQASGTVAAGSGNPVLSRTGCVQGQGTSSINGLLTVIDVASAEATPGNGAILATVAAGCSPVRMAETSDNSTLWLAARGDDRVLAFGTALLESNPDNSLLRYASTGGTAPVGVCLFHNDEFLAVANSNRFGTGTANATILYVASPASASVVNTIGTGFFPREITVGTDDATLYLTNFLSDTLQAITTTIEEP